MKRFDTRTATTYDNEGAPEGFGATWARIGQAIGAQHLNANLLVVPPGARSAPYHWEASQEEWLIVLDGTPTVRTPEGEATLRPGDVVCFEVGPGGAHQVINRSDHNVRFILLSDVRRPEVIVYPDSDKVMITDPGVDVLLRLDAEVDYWEGEA